MAAKTDGACTTYPPSTYAVGREKVGEHALAVWGPAVIAGEEITTRASVTDIYGRKARGF